MRLIEDGNNMLCAVATTSDGRRIEAETLNGCTGDPWMPVNRESKEPKSLTITGQGFDYKRAVELAFGTQFLRPITSQVLAEDGNSGVSWLAQGVARGQTDQLAKLARERIEAIEAVRNVLWGALCTLLDNAKERKDKPQAGIAERANRFAKPFEADADARFFADLALEIEASTPDESQQVRAAWLLDLEARAEAILRAAFSAGPRSAQRRYQAQAAALGRFQGGLRGKKSPLPELARLHAERRASAKTQGDALPSLLPEESNHEHA